MPSHASKGFTLVELMIVVVIVTLLAAFAYPAYLEYARKARRSDGIEMLNRVMQAQERYFTNNLTYTTELTDMGFSVDAGLASEEGWYRVSATECGDGIDDCVELTAVAQGDQVADGDLSLDSRGRRGGNW